LIVLGFDTATPATAVALRLADGSTLRARDDPGAGERPGHTTRLLGLAHELLARAELPWDALELIAVGVGPGTFTGLRIGVATARGLAQSLGIDVVAVSTPRVLAAAALRDGAERCDETVPRDVAPHGEGGAHAGDRGVLAAIDARRGEAFLAAYAGERELLAPQALAPAAFADFLAQAAHAAGRRVAGEGWVAVGDGAVRFRDQLEAVGVAVAAEGSALNAVDAGVLCELALAQPRGAPEAVLPDYRRRPDAEIALEHAES
jgi:tRNA threonylcarbamoyladenosine biosynthesis protein TsaB